jgi:predicted nucleic acid-binding protein
VSAPGRPVLVDSNVLLDVLTEDPRWYSCFERIEELDEALPPDEFVRLPLPWAAAFLAGKCFLAYRRAGGERRSPLPDFFIGAHAAVDGMTLLTRDPGRYRTYLPRLALIAPGCG